MVVIIGDSGQFQVKYYRERKQICTQSAYNLIPCWTVILQYYTTYSLITLIFEIYFTCNVAKYQIIKPHEPCRYNRIVVFNHCGVYSPYNAWAPSCWNTTSASQLEADLVAASVQKFAENFISLCRQLISYQLGDNGNVPDDNSPSVQDEKFSKPKFRDSMWIIPWLGIGLNLMHIKHILTLEKRFVGTCFTAAHL